VKRGTHTTVCAVGTVVHTLTGCFINFVMAGAHDLSHI
jgi:hypothetical protein